MKRFGVSPRRSSWPYLGLVVSLCSWIPSAASASSHWAVSWETVALNSDLVCSGKIDSRESEVVPRAAVLHFSPKSCWVGEVSGRITLAVGEDLLYVLDRVGMEAGSDTVVFAQRTPSGWRLTDSQRSFFFQSVDSRVVAQPGNEATYGYMRTVAGQEDSSTSSTGARDQAGTAYRATDVGPEDRVTWEDTMALTGAVVERVRPFLRQRHSMLRGGAE